MDIPETSNLLFVKHLLFRYSSLTLGRFSCCFLFFILSRSVAQTHITRSSSSGYRFHKCVPTQLISQTSFSSHRLQVLAHISHSTMIVSLIVPMLRLISQTWIVIFFIPPTHYKIGYNLKHYHINKVHIDILLKYSNTMSFSDFRIAFLCPDICM